MSLFEKKNDVTESCYGQNISSHSFSQRLEQVVNQGMRVHTIRDSYYHREKGAVKTQGKKAANTSKVR